MIRLCALDLDGTLLSSEKTVTAATAAAVRELASRGACVAVITGRPPCYAEAYLRQIGTGGFVAASNGSFIRRLDGDVIYSNEFSPALTAAVTSLLGSRGSRFGVQTETGIAGNMPMDPDIADRFIRYRETSLLFGNDVALPFTDPSVTGREIPGVLKIAVTADPEGIETCLAEIAGRFPEVCVSMSGRTVGDINLAGDSKGDALRRISRVTGADRSEICCFGDYDNDLSMFREAGISVAMGNASDALKKEADFITLTNDRDGIADAIHRILLNSD